MCSRIGASAPRSPEDKSRKQIQATHPFTQLRSRPAEIVLGARLEQLRANGRREHGTLYEIAVKPEKIVFQGGNMTTFYLIRHGEPDWDFIRSRNITGALRDFAPLTENGIYQAEQVSNSEDYLNHCELILSSPYTRSLQTAEIMNRIFKLPLRVEYDLHEWTPDNWQAKSVEEIMEFWKDYMDNNGCCPPGENKLWETKESVRQRTQAVLRKYTHFSNVIVVCHGMVIAALIDLSSDDVGF